MTYIELACFIVGLAAIVIGYRRNKRIILLLGAILWLLSGALSDFTRGYLVGFSGTSPIPIQSK